MCETIARSCPERGENIMQTRIDEAADSLMAIIRHYSKSSEYLAEYANVVVQAATALAELAKVATK